MNNPSSPTPPPSPESLPSSSDDCHEFPRENISTFSGASSSASHSFLGNASISPSLPSSMTNAATEPTSSTQFSSVNLLGSQNGFTLNNDEPMATGSTNFMSGLPSAVDQSPSSSKNKSDSLVRFRSSCSASPNHFSSEVTSSDMDVDMPPINSNHRSNTVDNEVECHWVADSSEGATSLSYSHNAQDNPLDVGETMVSRSTWQVNRAGNITESETFSSEWSSELYASGTSDVTSTGPPDTNKINGRSSSSSKWSLQDPSNMMEDSTASTSSCTRDAVNSSMDEDSVLPSWCPQSTEGAVGMSWQCDSPNASVAGPSISPSSSSSSLGASIPLSPWPPPLSSTSAGTASSITSSSQHYPTNPNVNSTSAINGEVAPQVFSWRSRASSSPISLTRVTPTTPPPRPPTPPCTSRTRAIPHSPRRSVSPQDRFHSPSRLRRSVSPPLRQHFRSTPPTPSRRSLSPPLRGRGLSQLLPSQRRSESPISLQQSLAQPPSPSGRHRLSPRPRSARTPSPRPPRPPNSTPEPSPSPSQQHSPRPHHAKMRGR